MPAPDPFRTTDFQPATIDHARVDTATVDGAPNAGSIDSFPKVPGYAIESVLGRGGMGVVYRARHLALKRTVALKMILAGGHAGPRELARFRAETEAVARLQHPNIVQVFEVGAVDGHPFCALEFVEGGNLATKLDGKPIPNREAAKLIEALASAMHLAHSRNVVHRDLKPANVLIATDGSPKVTDFGLARQLDDDSGITQAGSVMGTPSYMAPEQAAGRANEAGPAADVYSLGAILYECLTGRPPFKGATVIETLDQVRTQEPIPPSRLQPRTPPDLETICLKCLRKEPEKRYVSAGELAADLGRFGAGEPIAARPVGTTERLIKWARRRPTAAALIAVVAVSAVVLLFGGLYFLDRLAHERNDAVNAGEASKRAAASEAVERKNAEQQRDRAEGLWYFGQLKLSQVAWNDNNAPLAMRYLEETQPEQRGWEYRQLYSAFTSNQQTFATPALATAASISPDGSRVAASVGNDIHVWDVVANRELFVLKGHNKGVLGAQFGDEGRLIVSGGYDRSVRVWDAKTGNALFQLDGHTGTVNAVAFSPDGKRIASASSDRTVRIWDVEKRQVIHKLLGHSGLINALAFRRDGLQIVTGDDDGLVKVWDVAVGREAYTLRGHTTAVRGVCFHPDGKSLFAAGGLYGRPGEVFAWDTTSQKRTRAFDGHLSAVAGLTVSPDGQRLATACWDGNVRLWDINTGRILFTLRGHLHDVLAVSFAADGKRLVSAGGHSVVSTRPGEVKIWDVETGQEPPALRGHTNRVQAVAFMSGGHHGPCLASASDDGTLKIWDVQDARDVLTIPILGGGGFAVAFSPNGRRVAVGGGQLNGQGAGALAVYDVESGQLLKNLPGHDNWVMGVRFSPDGRHLASASVDATVRIWDMATGQTIHTLKAPKGLGFSCLEYSPDGTRLAAGSTNSYDPRVAGEITLWNTTSGQEVATLLGHASGVTAVCFSADGKQLASASDDDTARLWDIETGESKVEFQGHTRSVRGVCMTADGKRLITASSDRTVRVWNTANGREVLSLAGHTMGVNGVALSRDDRCLVSASEDGTIRLWRAERP